MLVNFTTVQNIFIVCGHTDMHCGIDGLANVITDKYDLDLFNDAIFLFCGRKKIDTKLCIGIVMDLYYCTNGSKMEIYNGQKIKMKLRN